MKGVVMNEEKIRKVAYWIAHKSDNRFDEIEWLLYGLYGIESSGLPTDIDEAYGDVIKLMSEEEE
jgi:hypothetical protein